MTQVLLFVENSIDSELVKSYLLDLQKSGFSKVTLANPAPLESLQEYFLENEPEGCSVSFLEMRSHDIFMAIKDLFEAINCEDLLVINGDRYFSIDFSWFLENSKPHCSMALKFSDQESEEAIQINENYFIDPLSEQRHRESFIDGGVYYFTKEILDIEDTAVMGELAERGRLKGIPCGGKFINELSSSWLQKETKPCLFLDRDGIIIKDTGYPHKITDIHILEGIIPLIDWANKNNWHVIAVTNQAGIAKGKFKEEDFFLCSDHIDQKLSEKGVEIQDWYFCPYHHEGIVDEFKKVSLSRKPEPGLIFMAMSEYRIDINKSIMIGDKSSDKINLPGLRSLFLQGDYDLSDAAPIFSTHGEILEEIKRLVHV